MPHTRVFLLGVASFVMVVGLFQAGYALGASGTQIDRDGPLAK